MNNYLWLLFIEIIFIGNSFLQKINSGNYYANGLKLNNTYLLFIHIISSCIMWMCGHLQFWILPKKNINHRIIGYVYTINALTSGLTAILLAFNSKKIYGFLVTYSLSLGGFNLFHSQNLNKYFLN